MLWIGGFDIIYALAGLRLSMSIRTLFSLPKRLGKANALVGVAPDAHRAQSACLSRSASCRTCSPLAFVGIGIAALLIAWEQSLVKPNDLSRVNLAFFTLNGWVSVSLFAFVLLDQLISRR